jgi:hypothetical protein
MKERARNSIHKRADIPRYNRTVSFQHRFSVHNRMQYKGPEISAHLANRN